MTQEEKSILLSKIENEGPEYCFLSYSDWEEIKDPEFHKLRDKYIMAANDLEDYINER